MAKIVSLVLITPLFMALMPMPQTVELQPDTIAAFETYVAIYEEEMEKNLSAEGPFLWSDMIAESAAVKAELRAGGTAVGNLVEDPPDIPGGLMHDWAGGVYIPGKNARQVVDFLHDYDGYHDVFPDIIQSRKTSEDGDTIHGFLRIRRKAVLTAVFNTDNEMVTRKISNDRWFVVAKTTRVAEVKDAGEPGEQELPVGKDRGFLWRLYGYWKVENVDGGVIVECRTLSLSRAIPRGLGWIVKPFIKDLPVEALEETLTAIREALKGKG